MLRNFFTTLFFGLFLSAITAQELGVAIVVSHDDSKVSQLYFQEFVKEMNALGFDNLVFYDWDKETHKLKLSEVAASLEKPVKTAFFIEQLTPAFDKRQAQLSFESNKEGIATRASIPIDFKASYKLRAIDVKTGKVLMTPLEVKMIRDVPPGLKPGEKPFLPLGGGTPPTIRVNLSKYMKGKVKVQKLASNTRLKKKILVDLAETMENVYWKDAIDQLNSLPLVIGKLAYQLRYKEELYKIEVPDSKSKKVKKITVLAGTNNGIRKRDKLAVYTTMDVNGQTLPFFLAKVYVDKVEADRSYCSLIRYNYLKGKLTNALTDEKERLFATKIDVIPSSKINYTEEDIINIRVKNDKCATCALGIEKELVFSPTVNLLERLLEPELEQLFQLYHDSRFIDYDMDEVQDKLLGAKYLITIKDRTLRITDIATGEIFISEEFRDKPNYSGFLARHAWRKELLKLTGKKMSLIQVVKEKKGKVEQVIVYHPFAFSSNERFDVFLLEEEIVSGKVVSRKKNIANLLAGNAFPGCQLKLLYVVKGEKELYNAIHEGKELLFDVAVKR